MELITRSEKRAVWQGKESGFTLVEIAIVAVIFGLLLSGLAGSLGSYRENARLKETERYLENARKALLAFVAINGHLPCPDTDGDGDESNERNAETCDAWRGELPYISLGLERETPWNQPAFYVAHRSVEGNDCDGSKEVPQCFFSTNEFDLTTTARDTTQFLSVQDADGNTVAEPVVAIVGSYGENGLATFADCDNGTRSDDEQENCDTEDEIFVQSVSRTANSNDGFFDDQLIWIDELALKDAYLQSVAATGQGGNATPAPEPTSCSGISNCLEGSDANDNSYDSSPGSNGTLFGTPDGTVIAKDGDDRIEGGSGGQDIYAGKGDDVIFGGNGSDTVSGGEGDDLFIRYANETGIDVVDGGDGVDRIDLECEGGDSVVYIVDGASHSLRSQDGIVSIGNAVSGEIQVNGQLIIQFMNMETLRAFTYSGPCN